MPEDARIERAVRPKTLAEYEGQLKVRDQMQLFVDAARNRSEPLDHTLIFGPPGLGKTTLANIISHEMGASLKSTSGPVLERAGDLAAILTNLEAGEVLFIDEIHRLSASVEEVLYPAMEDYQLDIMIGEGPAARSIKLDLPPFTLVGATTRAGLLTSPLRDRFGIVQRLEFYSEADLAKIVSRSAGLMGIECEAEGASAEVRADRVITQQVSDDALNLLHVDAHGFDQMDRKLLSVLANHFNGGPVGIESLAASLGEERGTLEEVIEPYLIQQGYLHRTSRGRTLTQAGYQVVGLNGSADDLFQDS